MQEFLESAIAAAKLGGEVLQEYWDKKLTIESKGDIGDLVTEVDRASETSIINYLHQHYPSHAIVSEEGGGTQGFSDYQWVIDPLDGTTNYTHHHPMVAISIALLYQDKPVVGVVYNPIHEELYTAAKGLGATLNGKPIHVSQAKSLEKSLLATGFAYDRVYNPDNNLAEFCHLTNTTQGVRRGGSAALDLAYVAAGRLDGFWESGLKIWDIAAGVVLVEEAGGQTTAYDQSPLILSSGRILATNGAIHTLLSDSLIAIGKNK